MFSPKSSSCAQVDLKRRRIRSKIVVNTINGSGWLKDAGRQAYCAKIPICRAEGTCGSRSLTTRKYISSHTVALRAVLHGAAAVFMLALVGLPVARGQTAPAPATNTAKYVGSRACQPCHAQIYARWQKTPMANVVRDPREHPEAIIPDLASDTIAKFTKDEWVWFTGAFGSNAISPRSVMIIIRNLRNGT